MLTTKEHATVQAEPQRRPTWEQLTRAQPQLKKLLKPASRRPHRRAVCQYARWLGDADADTDIEEVA